MITRLDRTKCKAYGTCADLAPTVFELDEFGYAQIRVTDGLVPEGDEDATLQAEAGCPERAISHVD